MFGACFCPLMGVCDESPAEGAPALDARFCPENTEGVTMKKNIWKFAAQQAGRGYRAAALGIFAALMVTAVSGCGSASKYEAAADTAASVSMSASEAWDGGIYENSAVMEEAAEAGYGEEYEQEQQAEAVQDQSRKLIKNVDMSVETEEFDVLIRHVETRVEELGGYVEQSSIYNGSYTSNYRSRSASITARIPAQKLDQFVTDVAEQSNVTRKSESVEDVTLQYVDLESHKKALLAEQESLLSMLEQAQSIEDIIAINAQLTDVRYRIESMESQLRTYDNKISYSTVYLNVEEVEQYEPYAPKSTWERVSEGFVKNLRKVGNGISDFFIEFVIALPIIVALAVIVGILGLILYAVIRASEKRAAKRREKMMAQDPGQYNRYGMRMDAGRGQNRGRAGGQKNGGGPAEAQQSKEGASTEDRPGEEPSNASSDVNSNGRKPFNQK